MLENCWHIINSAEVKIADYFVLPSICWITPKQGKLTSRSVTTGEMDILHIEVDARPT